MIVASIWLETDGILYKVTLTRFSIMIPCILNANLDILYNLLLEFLLCFYSLDKKIKKERTYVAFSKFM